MLRHLIFAKSRTNDILTSKLYCDKSFYSAFLSDLKRARSDVLIESPFMSVKRTESMLPTFKRLVKHGVKVRINTRNPRHHNQELRIQAWQSIKRLRSVGVNVRFYNDMRHRKLAVLDQEILWEGSLNIMSQSNSRELMRRTHSKDMALQMIRFTGMNSWF